MSVPRLAACAVLLVAGCRGDAQRPSAASGGGSARPAAPVDASAELGTAHLLTVEAAARSGRWVVACQARDISPEAAAKLRRDVSARNVLSVSSHMVPYLIRGGGPGEAIEQLVAVSPDDHWLVVRRGGKLLLVDDAGGREAALPAATVEVSGRSRDVVAFDSDAAHLTYLQVTGAATKLVIRTLASQAERTVELPNEVVVGLVPEPIGHWARLWFRGPDGADPGFVMHVPSLSPEDAAEIGLTDEIRTRPTRCGYRAEPPWRFGLHAVQAWLDLDTGAVHRDSDVLARLGGVEIRRSPDGALWTGEAELTPASCKARVLGLSAQPIRILAICQSDEERAALEVFGPGLHVNAGTVPARPPNSAVQFFEGGYACVYPRTCIALRDGRVVPQGDGDPIAWGAHVVAADRGGLFFPTGPHPEARYPAGAGARQRAGAILSVGQVVLDLGEARILGQTPRPPLAVTTAGHALVAADADPGPWSMGPMRWVTPQQ